MPDEDATVRYVFEIVTNASEAFAQVAQDGAEAKEVIEEVTEKEEELEEATDKANTSIDSQQMKLIGQVVGILGLGRAIGQVSRGLHGLGIISDETAQKLQYVTSGFQVMTGLVGGIKALQLVSESLRKTEAGTAIIETYRKVMGNPALASVALIGGGIAVGAIGGYLLNGGGGGGTTNNVEAPIIFNTDAQRDLGTGVSQVVNVR